MFCFLNCVLFLARIVFCFLYCVLFSELCFVFRIVFCFLTCVVFFEMCCVLHIWATVASGVMMHRIHLFTRERKQSDAL